MTTKKQIAPKTDHPNTDQTDTMGRKVKGLRAYFQHDVASPPSFKSLAELIATTQALAHDVERAKLTTAQGHLAAALAAYVRRRQTGDEKKALSDVMGAGVSGDYMRSAVRAGLDAHAERFATSRESDAHDTDAALIAQAIQHARGVNPHAIAKQRAEARRNHKGEGEGEGQDQKPKGRKGLGATLDAVAYGMLSATEAATLISRAGERIVKLATGGEGISAAEQIVAAKALESLAAAFAPYAKAKGRGQGKAEPSRLTA